MRAQLANQERVQLAVTTATCDIAPSLPLPAEEGPKQAGRRWELGALGTSQEEGLWGCPQQWRWKSFGKAAFAHTELACSLAALPPRPTVPLAALSLRLGAVNERSATCPGGHGRAGPSAGLTQHGSLKDKGAPQVSAS